MIKPSCKIELFREESGWGSPAHSLLQQYSKPGYTENEISMRASLEASLAMIRTLGNQFIPCGGSGAVASAGYQEQVGKNSALPHAVTVSAALRPGNVFVTGASARVFRYGSELECTMSVDEPSAEQRKWFSLMCEAEQVAFSAIEPGRECSYVDAKVRSYYEKHGICHTRRHHVGHALGLLSHEAPFFDIGGDTVTKPNMVFGVESGMYINEFGGFGHSDTLVVTDEWNRIADVLSQRYLKAWSADWEQ